MEKCGKGSCRFHKKVAFFLGVEGSPEKQAIRVPIFGPPLNNFLPSKLIFLPVIRTRKMGILAFPT